MIAPNGRLSSFGSLSRRLTYPSRSLLHSLPTSYPIHTRMCRRVYQREYYACRVCVRKLVFLGDVEDCRNARLCSLTFAQKNKYFGRSPSISFGPWTRINRRVRLSGRFKVPARYRKTRYEKPRIGDTPVFSSHVCPSMLLECYASKSILTFMSDANCLYNERA
jgi:hypothetical protein